MPFCGNCGTQMSDDARFCTKCGTQRSVFAPAVQTTPQPIVPEPSRPIFSGENEKVLFYKKYSNRAFSKQLFFIVLYILITYVLSVFTNSFLSDWADEYANNSEQYETIQDSLSELEEWNSYIIFLTIIISALLLIKCFRITKNNIYITDKRVYGDACPRFGFGLVSFNLEFRLIHSATVKGDALIITTTGSQTKYYCFIDNPDAARRIINDMLYGK